MKRLLIQIMLTCLMPASVIIAGAPADWTQVGFNEKAFSSVFDSEGITFNDVAYGDSRNDLPSPRHPYGQEHGWMAVGDDFVMFHYDGANAHTQRLIKSPDPYFPDLNTVRYNQGRWLVTGERGAILTSVDTENWEMLRVGEEVNWVDQGHGSSTWVVVGWDASSAGDRAQAEGWIATSKDAFDWSTARFPGFKIESVARGPTHWVVSGHVSEGSSSFRPALMISDDAIQWKSIDAPGPLREENGTFRHLEYSHGAWVGVIETRSANDFVRSHVLISESLNSWEETLALKGEVSQPRYGQEEWIFLQKPDQDATSQFIYQSDDGRNWNIVDAVETRIMKGKTVTSAEGLRMAAGTPDASGTNHLLAASRYELAFHDTTSPLLFNVMKHDNEWFATGSDERIYFSVDGRQWSSVDSGADEPLISVCKGPGSWAALGGNGGVWSSVEGRNWYRLHQFEGVIPLQIKSGQDRWVAICMDASDIYRQNYFIFSSDNLLDWEKTEYKDLFGNHRLAFGNDRWVVHGYANRRLISLDGDSWTSYPGPVAIGYPCDLAFGDGQFITSYCTRYNLLDVADLYRSVDGINWQRIRNGGPVGYSDGWWWCNTLYERWLHSRWTEFMISKDGLHWDKIGDPRINFPGEGNISHFIREENSLHVFARGEHYIYVSNIKDSVKGKGRPGNMATNKDQWLAVDGDDLLLSSDGLAWTQAATLDQRVDQMAFGNGTWGLVQFINESPFSATEGHPVFSTFDPGSLPHERFQLENETTNAQELEYHFGRWWLLVGQNIYAFKEDFQPELLFEGKGHLLRDEMVMNIEFSDDRAIAVTNMGTFIQSEKSSEFKVWELESLTQRYNDIDRTWRPPNVTYQDFETGNGIWMGVHVYKESSTRSVWIERSVDGLSWERFLFEPEQLVRNEFTARIAHSNGWWVLCTGGDKLSASSSTKFFISKDGRDWTLTHEEPLASRGPEKIVADNHQWFAMISGKLTRSGPDVWLELDRDHLSGHPHITVNSVQANKHFSIERSEDLKQWQIWRTAKSGIGPMKLDPPKPKVKTGIFFRPLTPPE